MQNSFHAPGIEISVNDVRLFENLVNQALKYMADMAYMAEKEKLKPTLNQSINQILTGGIEAPNDHEITLGREEGKLAAIKAYRIRTGHSLKDSKNAIETYFQNWGLRFKL